MHGVIKGTIWLRPFLNHIKLVVRSTFAAELLALTASVDHSNHPSWNYSRILKTYRPSDSMYLRETGGYCLDLHIWIDAKSVFSAVENEWELQISNGKVATLSYFMDQTTSHPQDYTSRLGRYQRHGCRWHDQMFYRHPNWLRLWEGMRNAFFTRSN